MAGGADVAEPPPLGPAGLGEESSSNDPKRRFRHGTLAVVYALPFAIGPLLDVAPEAATFRGVAGPRCPIPPDAFVPCPGCGLTRGFAATLQGSFDAAQKAHPAAIVVVVLAGLGVVLHAIAAARGSEAAWLRRGFVVGRAIFLLAMGWTVAIRALAR
jgi:hypothetical protein